MSAVAPQVTAIYLALNALLLLLLTWRVIARRREARIGLGDGGDSELLRRMRVHGNAVETMPLQLLLLLVLELLGGPAWMLHACGLGIFLARALHAIGLSGSPGVSFGRFWGTLLSLTLLLLLPLLLLARVSGLY